MAELPEKIGRYEVLELVGKGGMGHVYKARDPNIDRLVALKVIRLSPVAGGEDEAVARERFTREARAAGKLIHPNIVTVYDADEHEGVPFIAMEFVEGEPLDVLLARAGGAIPEGAGDIARQVAQALEFAHERGIIHRDIKPANVIITPGGAAKIMDFGIARLSDSDLTQEGTVMGSPSYMSPEQITGHPVDQRSDLFSLGAMLYQMLTGLKPFAAENQAAIAFRIVKVDPIRPSRMNPAVEESFDAVIQKALDKDPTKRYQSAREFIQDLERIERGEKIEFVDDSTAVVREDTAVIMAAPVEQPRAPAAAAPKWEQAPSRPKKRAAIIGGGVLLVALVAMAWCGLGPHSRAKRMIRSGHAAEAAELLAGVIADKPDDHRAHLLMGEARMETGNYSGAYASFARAIDLRPKYREDPELLDFILNAPAAECGMRCADMIADLIGDPARPALLEAIEDPDYNRHWNANAALGEMGETVNILPLLVMDLEENPDCEIRRRAVVKMGSLGDEAAIPHLEKARDKKWNQDDCMGDAIGQAIERIEGGGDKKTRSGQPLKALKEDLKKIFK